MTAPTSPTRVIPANKELIYGPEAAAAGTPATAFTREPCRSIVTNLVRTTETQTEYTGVAAAHVGEDRMFEYAQTDITLPLRVAGLGAFGLMTMLGNGADTVSGTTPKIHTGLLSALTTSMNTWTIVHDDGDRNSSNVAQNLLQMPFGTLNSYSLTYQPNGVVTSALQFFGVAPTTIAVPTITTYVGSTANYPNTRFNPNVCTWTVISSSGSAYTAKISQATLNLTRNVSPEFALGSKDPYDIVPSDLMVSGGFTATFDGNQAASIRRDYLNFAELGVVGTPHSISMVIDGNNSIVINFYPIKLQSATVDNSGRVKVSCTFSSYNDVATLNQASPVISTIKSVVISNALSAVMVT